MPAVQLGLGLRDQRRELHVRVHQLEEAVEVTGGEGGERRLRKPAAVHIGHALSMPS
jgi:hypothetical protein